MWLAARLADLQARWTSGELNRCEHLRDGDPVRRVLLALWSSSAVCDKCAQRLRLTGDADRTCDKCGRLAEPHIYPGLVGAAPGVVVAYGLCGGCRGSEVAA